MNKIVNALRNPSGLVLCLLTFYLLSFLSASDSFYEPYLLIGGFGLYSHFYNQKHSFVESSKLIIVFSLFLSCCVLFANYEIAMFSFQSSKINIALKCIRLLFLLYPLYYLFKNILVFVTNFKPSKTFLFGSRKVELSRKFKKIDIVMFGGKSPQIRVFVFSFAFIMFIDLLVLFIVDFPCVASPDSYNSLQQIMGDTPYNNAHPVIYTLFLSIFVNAGLAFNNMNVGLALYSVAQTIILSLSFAYSLMSIYQITNSKKLTVISLLFISLMPVNIVYSHIVWKDVIFAAGVLVFGISIYRYLNNVGKRYANILIMLCGAFVFCTFRKNGVLAFMATIILMLIICRKRKALFACLACVVVFQFAFTSLVNSRGVTDFDSFESLSIPTQQVARVIYDEKELTQEQSELISHVADLQKIKQYYLKDVNDTVKNFVIRADASHVEYFENHKSDFLKLYIDLGIKYPTTYFKAWIDQTRGFWNAGYEVWVNRGIMIDDYGIQPTSVSLIAKSVFDCYTAFMTCGAGFKLLYSNGVYFWLYIIALFVAIKRNDRAMIVCLSAFLFLVGTFLVSTPISADLRYAYYLYCGAPFVASILLSRRVGSFSKQ